MGVLSNRFFTTILLITILHFTVRTMALTTHRVVFQTFSLSEEGEIVECYGLCGKDRKDFRMQRCEGLTIRLGCVQGNHIEINQAFLGKLNPELNICTHNDRLECSNDIVRNIKTICMGQNTCVIDIGKENMKNRCENLDDLAVDIRYSCKAVPATNSSTAVRTTSVVSSTISTVQIMTRNNKSQLTKQSETKTAYMITKSTTSTKVSTTSKRTSTTDEHTVGTRLQVSNTKSPVNTNPMPSMSSPYSKQTQIVLARNKSIIIGKVPKDTDLFWTKYAFNAITDSEYVQQNKSNLALVLLLSMFLGMVLCLCICLDYCRRAKKKKGNTVSKWNELEVTESQVDDYNERIELINSDMVDVTKNTLPNQHSVRSCNNNNNNNNNNNHGRSCDENDGDIYINMSVSTPLFNKPNVREKKRPFSPRKGLNPCADLNVHTPSTISSSGMFIEGNNKTPSVMLTRSSPTKGPMNANNGVRDLDEYPDVTEIDQVYIDEANSNEKIDCCHYEYMEDGQYYACDDCSSSTHISNSIPCHEVDTELPQSKFNSMPRRATSNDETSNEEIVMRTLDSKRIRKSNPKERPLIQKSKSCDEQKKKTYFVHHGHQHFVRNPRRGRVHVMQKCPESSSSHPCNTPNNKTTHSDNEISRRKRHYEMDQGRACTCCEHETSLNDMYCTRCGKHEQSHMDCCSSIASNCHSSRDGDFVDRGPLLSISNELIKNKQSCVEESGYQSHDTCTDSLGSSSFSTDQEDSRMFLPSSVHHTVRHCRCRSHISHNRNQIPKRAPKCVILPEHNKVKTSRRVRRDDYVKCDTHPPGDVHSYDSSMDESSGRDSVKIFRNVRKQNMSDENRVQRCKSENQTCSCHCAIKSTDCRVDGIETS